MRIHITSMGAPLCGPHHVDGRRVSGKLSRRITRKNYAEDLPDYWLETDVAARTVGRPEAAPFPAASAVLSISMEPLKYAPSSIMILLVTRSPTTEPSFLISMRSRPRR